MNPAHANPSIPFEAVEHYKRAQDLLYNMENEHDVKSANEASAQYALAIAKANGYYPAARAELGMSLMLAGQQKKGENELKGALRQDPNCSLARGLLISLEMEKLGIGNLPPTGHWFGDLLVLGGQLMVSQTKVQLVSNKVDELINVLPMDFSANLDTDYWLRVCKILLHIHDKLQNMRLMPRKGRVAKAIVDARWDLLNVPEDKISKVKELKESAEGRLLLAR
mgnify:CR=1 FL=1